MGRIIAIDYGKKRCGIAETDPLQIIASGLTTVATGELLTFLKKYFERETVDLLVIGLSINFKGEANEIEEDISAFIKKINATFPNLKIAREDERMSSVDAFQTMLDSGISKKRRRDKALIDQISATVILQRFLNHS